MRCLRQPLWRPLYARVGKRALSDKAECSRPDVGQSGAKGRAGLSIAERIEARRAANRMLAGTVGYYDRHLVFIDRRQSAKEWDSDLSKSESHPIFKFIKEYKLQHSSELPVLKITAAEAGQYASRLEGQIGETGEGYELLLFPEQVRIRGVKELEIPQLVRELLREKTSRESLQTALSTSARVHVEPLRGVDLFVCCHSKRDFRCDCRGHEVVRHLEAAARTLTTKYNQPGHLRVLKSSHVGGHRYAANCVVYPGGDWYGNIETEEDAYQIVDMLLSSDPSTIEGSQRLLNSHWRGRMGLTKEKQLEMHAENATSPATVIS